MSEKLIFYVNPFDPACSSMSTYLAGVHFDATDDVDKLIFDKNSLIENIRKEHDKDKAFRLAQDVAYSESACLLKHATLTSNSNVVKYINGHDLPKDAATPDFFVFDCLHKNLYEKIKNFIQYYIVNHSSKHSLYFFKDLAPELKKDMIKFTSNLLKRFYGFTKKELFGKIIVEDDIIDDTYFKKCKISKSLIGIKSLKFLDIADYALGDVLDLYSKNILYLVNKTLNRTELFNFMDLLSDLNYLKKPKMLIAKNNIEIPDLRIYELSILANLFNNLENKSENCLKGLKINIELNKDLLNTFLKNKEFFVNTLKKFNVQHTLQFKFNLFKLADSIEKYIDLAELLYDNKLTGFLSMVIETNSFLLYEKNLYPSSLPFLENAFTSEILENIAEISNETDKHLQIEFFERMYKIFTFKLGQSLSINELRNRSNLCQ